MSKNIGSAKDYALTPHVIGFYMDPKSPNKIPETSAEVRGPSKNNFVKQVVASVKRLHKDGKVSQIKARGGNVGIEDWNVKEIKSKKGKISFKSIFKGRPADVLYYIPK